jgi:hypothetical protein
MKLSAQNEFNIKLNQLWGVACGTQFPDESRIEARRLGSMIVYPSGRRYLVESDKIDIDFAIERGNFLNILPCVLRSSIKLRSIQKALSLLFLLSGSSS